MSMMYIANQSLIQLSPSKFSDLMIDCLKLQYKLDRTVIQKMHDGLIPLRPINPLTALRVEVGEAIEYLEYKWWKLPKKVQKDLLFNEVIDVLHFILSNYIKSSYNGLYHMSIEDDYLNELLFKTEINEDFFKLPFSLTFDTDVFNDDINIAMLEDIIKTTFWHKDYPLLQYILQKIYILANSLGYQDVDIYKHYIGKNALNNLRMASEYGGSYKKVWNDGREDNAHMIDLINEMDVDEVTVESVLEELTDLYNLVNID